MIWSLHTTESWKCWKTNIFNVCDWRSTWPDLQFQIRPLPELKNNQFQCNPNYHWQITNFTCSVMVTFKCKLFSCPEEQSCYWKHHRSRHRRTRYDEKAGKCQTCKLKDQSLFSLDVVSRYWSKVSVFWIGWATLSTNFRWKGISLTNLFSCQKTTFMWYENISSMFFRFVTKHACDRQTDGRTELQSPRLR